MTLTHTAKVTLKAQDLRDSYGSLLLSHKTFPLGALSHRVKNELVQEHPAGGAQANHVDMPFEEKYDVMVVILSH